MHCSAETLVPNIHIRIQRHPLVSSVRNVRVRRALVIQVFRAFLPSYSRFDRLFVSTMLRETRIDFIAAMSSGSNSDTTHLRLRLDDERKELWISDLRVAVDFRGQGIGRQLVRCAELLAQELEIPLVSLFPLRGSSQH